MRTNSRIYFILKRPKEIRYFPGYIQQLFFCLTIVVLLVFLVSLVSLRARQPIISQDFSSSLAETDLQADDIAVQAVNYHQPSFCEQEISDNASHPEDSVSLSALSINQSEFDEITSTRNESEDLLFSELFFNEAPLFILNDDSAFYSITNDNGKNAYDPFVRIETDIGNVQLAILDYNLTESTVKENLSHSLLIFSEDRYHIYYLKCTTLPIINIDTDSGTQIGNEYVSMKIKLLDNGSTSTSEVVESLGKIHNRGNSSNKKWYSKKSFRVGLLDENGEKNKVSLLGLREDDDYILYSAYNDHEKVRNVFSSNLWYDTLSDNNVFGINFGNEYRFVELFINKDYYGLYALSYPIDAKQVKLQADECLFKKVSPDNELIEFISSGPVRTFELKENGLFFYDDEMSAWKLLRDFCKCLFFENNYEYGSLKTLSDIDNQIDNYLFVMLIQGGDNSTKNFFLLSKVFESTRLMECIPWDFDLTWGNIFADANLLTKSYGIDEVTNVPLPYNVAYHYIKQGDDEIIAKVKERYTQLREFLWSDTSINEYIDKYESDIFFSGAYSRDKERWPDGNYLEDCSTGLSVFRQYVLKRLEYFDSFISQLGQ